MVLNVYTAANGLYILVPECMKASLEARRLHGTLQFCARIDSDDYPYPKLWIRVSANIDEQLFATIDAAVGKWLMGLECTAPRDRTKGIF